MSSNFPRVTHTNVDDLERCLAISADIAPAFEDQAQQWLDPANGKFLEPGVRERLEELVDRRTRARAFVDRWGVGLRAVAADSGQAAAMLRATTWGPVSTPLRGSTHQRQSDQP